MSTKQPDRRPFLKGAATASALAAADVALGASSDIIDTAGTGPMPMRTLGRTGEKVPILHFGTSQRLDQTHDKVMHRCLKGGVSWFDTALSYGWGSSHSATANFLGQSRAQKNMWLTSKSGSGSVGGLEKGLDEALAELKTDFLDIYLMHGIDDEDMLEPKFIKAGERFRQSGKTRFFGFSCHDGNVAQLLDKAARVGGIDVILFRYNFRRYGALALNKAMEACHKAGIGLLAMKSMGSVPNRLESVVDFRSEKFMLGQAKLKSIWADERISSVVSEMDSVQRVRENVSAAKTERHLTAEEGHQLNRLAALTAQYACNGCSHLCEQAAGGHVAIADPLRFL
ncbi:MAG: aldo/keto reductase, partial [Chromatiales bacterium]|nr:aldo/keto reductase [Chromatiales bacterium]